MTQDPGQWDQQGGGYPPQGPPPYPPQAQQPGGYQPQQPGYPPQQPAGYPPQQPGYPPQADIRRSRRSDIHLSSQGPMVLKGRVVSLQAVPLHRARRAQS